MRDPAGLLDRVPELEAFVADSRFRQALATGDPFAVHRYLFWGRYLGWLPAGLTAQANELIRKRRYFGVPLSGPPVLGRTVYGSGLRLYGAAEMEKDGGHIATRYVTVLFVPLLPLASYLVRTEQRMIRFIARVPLAWWQACWNGLVVLALVLVVLLGAWGAWRSSEQTEPLGQPASFEDSW